MDKKFSLEDDLKKSQFIVEKCKNSDIYAQNLYATLCNNDFVKNEPWPILKQETWSCSWRYAGGIIADIRQQGDYMDWYCSGILMNKEYDDDQFNQLTKEQQELYIESKQYLTEGVVSEEIKQDLKKIGWIVFTDYSDKYD